MFSVCSFQGERLPPATFWGRLRRAARFARWGHVSIPGSTLARSSLQVKERNNPHLSNIQNERQLVHREQNIHKKTYSTTCVLCTLGSSPSLPECSSTPCHAIYPNNYRLQLPYRNRYRHYRTRVAPRAYFQKRDNRDKGYLVMILSRTFLREDDTMV